MAGPVRACAVRQGRYVDSVRLMHVSNDLAHRSGILDAFAVMGSDANKKMAVDAGYPPDTIVKLHGDDLLVCVTGESESATSDALEQIDAFLSEPPTAQAIRTFEDALEVEPELGIAVISVPGEFAGDVARHALGSDLNVFLFSSNVSLRDEIELKQLAASRGLIVMGPDCGTSIISGVGLGFANAVRRGSIGVIGAAGTGIQAVTSLIHRMGGGISHAIGVGSRDLSDGVGGLSTFAALDALDDDPETEAIVIVSKVIGPKVRAELERRLQGSPKRIIECHLRPGGLTLEQAAIEALVSVGHEGSIDDPNRQGMDTSALRRSDPQRRYVRGLFAGGTFCAEAQMISLDAGVTVASNAPVAPQLRLADASISHGHALLDMGSEDYTKGRPHPMIDSRARIERLVQEAADPEVAVILFDIVLGYGAAMDPAGDLAHALNQVEEISGGGICLVASVCGTDLDIQGLDRQIKSLEGTGVSVFPSSERAMRAALEIVGVKS